MAGEISTLVATHGYWVVGAVVALESMGVSAPGETVLVTAAIFAGTTHRLSIPLIIAAAAIGARGRPVLSCRCKAGRPADRAPAAAAGA